MNSLKWWQKAVFYQIYPRSFADANGDGIGDLGGMIARLDDLKQLGIDAIWLSPHFPSPQYDCGYDVADYTNVDPDYGTLEEFKTFLQEAHKRGIRLILDLVLNHTSDQHPWFIESRSSRDNPKRDWYVWLDGEDGNPPNNWNSTFGGSAWEYDSATESYYYHFFFKQQPDLNWRNPEVKQAMFDAVRFWLDMGVDGFRLDAIGTIFEDIDLPDHPVEQSLEELMRLAYEAKTEEDQKQFSNLWESMFAYQHDQPGIHDLMRDLRSLIDEYDDRVLVGETDEISFYGSGDDELHMIFNFPLMRTDRITPIWVRENQRDRLAELPPGAWPCNTLNNHDTTRMRTAFSDGAHELDLVKLNLALMLTLKGTPFLYNGEEIGMTDYPLSEIGQFKDNLGVWTYHVAADVFGLPYEEAVKAASGRSRDKARTPCQWRNAPNGGFCPPDVQPWLPVNPNYQEGVNYEDQQGDAHSLLNYYRKLISVRRENPALIDGEFQTVDKGAEGYLAFLRTSEHQNFLVALNYSDSPQRLDLDLPASTIKVVFSSCTREGLEQTTKLNLEPFEVFIGQYVR